jgi:hypothetical protein
MLIDSSRLLDILEERMKECQLENVEVREHHTTYLANAICYQTLTYVQDQVINLINEENRD